MTTHRSVNQNPRFIRMAEVVALTGLSKSTIYALLHANKFPERRFPGGRAVVWLEAEVIEWMNNASKIPPSKTI